jgi:HAD superfamily hydrolase (TIGR01484 family)
LARRLGVDFLTLVDHPVFDSFLPQRPLFPLKDSLIPIAEIAPEALSEVCCVFSDIDETISTRGRILPQAFDALWRLHRAGYRVIPVTGRSAGWCDHIARFWPVDAVVGENGGFYFYHDGRKLLRRFLYDDAERAEFRRRLVKIRDRVLTEVPGCAIASDQLYREYDLAVDFCEDVPPLPRDQVLRIKQIFEEEGAQAKISSIHVNGWYGDFDKLRAAKLCARELLGIDPETRNRAFVYCGDSPNDSPMFGFFERSFGMANVLSCVELLDARPRYVTRSESGDGFVEVAELLLACKRGSV